jgi:hypothetical protein
MGLDPSLSGPYGLPRTSVSRLRSENGRFQALPQCLYGRWARLRAATRLSASRAECLIPESKYWRRLCAWGYLSNRTHHGGGTGSWFAGLARGVGNERDRFARCSPAVIRRDQIVEAGCAMRAYAYARLRTSRPQLAMSENGMIQR